MSESISCHDADGTEDKSKVSIYHYCGNCEGDIWEWSEEVVPSKTALLTKLRDEVEKECKNSEHRKGSVTSIGANGNEMTFFEPVLCGACKNFLALLEKVDE